MSTFSLASCQAVLVIIALQMRRKLLLHALSYGISFE